LPGRAGAEAAQADAAPVACGDFLSLPPAEVLPALHRLYAPVTNLSCSVRRTTSGDIRRNATLISQVVWARGDRLNVETLSPVSRRFVVDGSRVHARGAEAAAVEVTAVQDLPPAPLANLRSVPASPEELLSAVDPASARDLPPESPAARAVGFSPLVADAPARLTVLSFDGAGQVLSVVSYTDAEDRSSPLVSTSFASPVFPLDGVPLYQRQETRTSDAAGLALKTVSRFESLRVNTSLPDAIFDPGAFF